MKRNYLLIVLTAITILGSGFYIDRHVSASSFRVSDKALERAFSAAAEVARDRPAGRGCETIPYADLQRDCAEQARVRARWCSRPNSPVACGELTNPFAQAVRRNDRTEMQRLYNLGIERRTHAETCLNARIETQTIFGRSEGNVERDRRGFEAKQRAAKNIELKDFYGEMIAYADAILAYYEAEKDGHDQQITQVRTVFNGCDTFVERSATDME